MFLKKAAFTLLLGKGGLSHLNSKAEKKKTDLNHTIQNISPCRINVFD